MKNTFIAALALAVLSTAARADGDAARALRVHDLSAVGLPMKKVILATLLALVAVATHAETPGAAHAHGASKDCIKAAGNDDLTAMDRAVICAQGMDAFYKLNEQVAHAQAYARFHRIPYSQALTETANGAN